MVTLEDLLKFKDQQNNLNASPATRTGAEELADFTPPEDTPGKLKFAGESQDLKNGSNPGRMQQFLDRLKKTKAIQSGESVPSDKLDFSSLMSKLKDKAPDIAKTAATEELSPLETAALKEAASGGGAGIMGKTLGAAGLAFGANNVANNIQQGNGVGAADAAGGMVGTVAGMAGAGLVPSLAIPAAISTMVHGGMEAGKQQAESGIDENGMQSVPKEQTFGAQNPPPAQTPPSGDIPTSGTGPMNGPARPPNLLGPYDPTRKSIADLQPHEHISSQASKQSLPTAIEHAPEVKDAKTAAEAAMQESLNHGFSNNTVANLQDVQNHANKTAAYNNLLKSLNLVSSGIIGQKFHSAAPENTASNAIIDQRTKEAQDLVGQFTARGEQEKNDPKSVASANSRQFAQAMLKQSGINITIPDNVSASDLEKRFPQLQHLATTKETTDARKQIAEEGAANRKVSMAQIQAFKERGLQDRETGLNQIEEKNVNTKFDTNTKNETDRIQAANRVRDLIDSARSGNLIMTPGLRNTITNDVAIISAPIGQRVLGTSMNKTAINTAGTKIGEALQFWLDHPQNTLNPEFIAQLEKETNVLQDGYGQAIKHKVEGLKSGIGSAYGKNLVDSRYNTLMTEFGHDPKTGKYQAKTQTTGQFPRTVINQQTGHQATVSNAQELQDANSKGFN